MADGAGEYWGYIGEKHLWGVGIGRWMLQAALAEAQHLGLRRVYLRVLPANERAIALYRKFNFQELSARAAEGFLYMEIGFDGRCCMIVERYHSGHAAEWNQLVRGAANGTFLALRPYVEYHADRFEDHSLLLYDDQRRKLHAVLPANVRDNVLYSHQGLTYGGFITQHAYTFQLIEAFNAVNAYCQTQGLTTVVYKPLPHIYAEYPAENDLYCLFRLNAQLRSRLLAATVPQTGRLKFSGSRLQGVKRAEKAGLRVEKVAAFDEFWAVLEHNLQQKYGTSATHSLAEITYLQETFPDHIELYVVRDDTQVVAGAVMYLTARVAHTQYISASAEGQANGALDLLFHRLLNEVYPHKEYFDFGTSNEEAGRVLNTNLIFQKEGFGGRGVVHDVYEYNTNQIISG